MKIDVEAKNSSDDVIHIEATRSGPPWLRIGVVADTHVPDRVSRLHPGLLPALDAAGVDLILHAGDVCVPGVLAALGEIAPVWAARGNRDWAFYGRLPLRLRLDLAGMPVILSHGHGGWWPYLLDKWRYLWQGYEFTRYRNLLMHMAGTAKVIVFGHTHRCENRWHNGRLFFNPGSAGLYLPHSMPTYGILNVYSSDQMTGQIFDLEGSPQENRREVV